MPDNVDRRVLGAVRFVDATTGMQIRDRLVSQADAVVFRPVRGGCFAIFDAPSLAAHNLSFERAPVAPPVGSVKVGVSVRDPGGRYIARRFSLSLPRDPAPEHGDQEESLFQPVQVRMYPAPAASVGHGWALIRASISEVSTGRPLPATLLRVVRTSDATHLASGLTDDRGEALVAVPGIPVTSSHEGGGPVVTTEVDVTLNAYHDPSAPATADPDQMDHERATLPAAGRALSLQSGRTETVALQIEVPD
jgi:hypothetical protein